MPRAIRCVVDSGLRADSMSFYPPMQRTVLILHCVSIALSIVGMLLGAAGLLARRRRGGAWLMRTRNGRIQPHGTLLIALLITIYLPGLAVTELVDVVLSSRRASTANLVAVRILRHLPIVRARSIDSAHYYQTWAACVLAWSAWTQLPDRRQVGDEAKAELVVLGVDRPSAQRSRRCLSVGRLTDVAIALVFVALTVPILVSAIWMQVIASELDAFQCVTSRCFR